MRRILPLLLVLVALPASAGEPIPDIDVILEQNPGGAIRIDAPRGGAFDEVILDLPRDAARALRPGRRLPDGWDLSRKGRRLTVAGPDVTPPVRLRLSLGDADLPHELGYEVRRDGRVLLRRQGVVPPVVPAPQARGSLEGIVQLPERVSPGETVAFRALGSTLSSPAKGTARLPPGGSFVLSGVVAEPFDEDEWPSIARGLVNTTRSNIKLEAALPPDFELTGLPGACDELAPVAAALAAAGELGDGGSIPVSPADDAGGAATGWLLRDLSPRTRQRLSNVLKPRHDPAMGSIRNIRYAIAVAPEGGGAATGAPRPAGGEGLQTWRAAVPGAAPATVSWADDPGLTTDGEAVRLVALRAEPTAAGCRFGPRDPAWSEMAAASHPPRGGRPTGKPPQPESADLLSGTVYVAEVPEDLAPGAALSLQYVDLYGDVWLDVPRVPGVEVVPPPPAAEPGAAPAPCFEAATRFAQPGELICVCGRFPTPAAWQGLAIGGHPAGVPVSASQRTVWLRLPADLGLGPQAVSGTGEAGYAPSCRAEVEVIEIGGALDSERLLRGESTPMRLEVSGTTEPVPLRVRNLTPSIIEIEGGADQSVETSGGSPNTLTRPVRGLTRGNFDVEWTLAVPSCPCDPSGSTGR